MKKECQEDKIILDQAIIKTRDKILEISQVLLHLF
jgi:hypothetical protein